MHSFAYFGSFLLPVLWFISLLAVLLSGKSLKTDRVLYCYAALIRYGFRSVLP
ncbi:hypothetical protein RKLH11_1387 [Rhodobacteraceae bacterium KLH11]|nr:hypothetical protein RKLH11_1387 [Rhodobacteraceae bacterium KLH11]